MTRKVKILGIEVKKKKRRIFFFYNLLCAICKCVGSVWVNKKTKKTKTK